LLIASASSPTRSLRGPTSLEFQFHEFTDGQLVKPSWCLLVSTIYRAPDACKHTLKWGCATFCNIYLALGFFTWTSFRNFPYLSHIQQIRATTICLSKNADQCLRLWPVVCLRGGKRGTCLGPIPFWGASLRFTHLKFPYFWWKTYYSLI